MNDDEMLKEVKDSLIGRKVVDVRDEIDGLKICLSNGTEIVLITSTYPDGTYRGTCIKD